MWLDAVVTSTDRQNVLDPITPVTLALGERGLVGKRASR
jgi:hypothetical protein